MNTNSLSDTSRRALHLAEAEALRYNHRSVGTEHLLLGLLREDTSRVAKVMRAGGLTVDQLRSAIESLIGRGDRISLGPLPLAPRARTALDQATRDAARLHHPRVHTEHLLWRLMRDRSGVVEGVLEATDINKERLEVSAFELWQRRIVREGEVALAESDPHEHPTRSPLPTLGELVTVRSLGQSRPLAGGTIDLVSLAQYERGFTLLMQMAIDPEIAATAQYDPRWPVAAFDDDGEEFYGRAEPNRATGPLSGGKRDHWLSLRFWPALEITGLVLNVQLPSAYFPHAPELTADDLTFGVELPA